MGAELISRCVVHKNGPLTQKDYEAGIEHLVTLRERIAALNVNDWLADEPPQVEDTDIIVQVAEDMCCTNAEAINEILRVTENPEEIVEPLFVGARDLGSRPWNGAMIYYAGEMSWGDEPDGIAYQAIKWLFLLKAFKVMGLE